MSVTLSLPFSAPKKDFPLCVVQHIHALHGRKDGMANHRFRKE